MAMADPLIYNAGSVFGTFSTSTIANFTKGGNNGFAPALANLDSLTPQVYCPAQVVVMSVPRVFTLVKNGVAWFKSVFETQLVSMDGLDFTQTIETSSTPVGRTGQEYHVPTRQILSQITPSITLPELIGDPIRKGFVFWGNHLADNQSQAATWYDLIPSNQAMPPLVSSDYAATLIVIQFDKTHRPENIVGAFIMTNFFPTDLGSPGYHVNVNEVERPDRTITFTCIVQMDNNTSVVAISVARLLKLHEVKTQESEPVARVVDTSIEDYGIKYLLDNTQLQWTDLTGVIPNSTPTAAGNDATTATNATA